MKLAVTGTRNGMTEAQRKALESILRGMEIGGGKEEVFCHGSCKGVDVQAARIVRDVVGDRMAIIAHPGPDDDDCRETSGVDDVVMPGKTHFARNRDLVDKCDILLAFPLTNPLGEIGGTTYTVNYARKHGKTVVIVWPDGMVEGSWKEALGL